MPAPGISEARVLSVDDRVDRLSLIVEAMWELLEETGHTEEALRAKLEEIDARDGRVDGKVVRKPVPCRACGSSSPPGRATCQMCGEELSEVDTFGSL
jgi:predicted Zn-ribbon and HTH transcriptional regulator